MCGSGQRGGQWGSADAAAGQHGRSVLLLALTGALRPPAAYCAACRYEKARKLKQYIGGIRETYTRNWDSRDRAERQVGAAAHLAGLLTRRRVLGGRVLAVEAVCVLGGWLLLRLRLPAAS